MEAALAIEDDRLTHAKPWTIRPAPLLVKRESNKVNFD